MENATVFPFCSLQMVDYLNKESTLTKLGSGYGETTSRHAAGNQLQGQANRQARQKQEEHFRQQAPSTAAPLTHQQLTSQLSPSHLY